MDLRDPPLQLAVERVIGLHAAGDHDRVDAVQRARRAGDDVEDRHRAVAHIDDRRAWNIGHVLFRQPLAKKDQAAEIDIGPGMKCRSDDDDASVARRERLGDAAAAKVTV